MSHSSLSLFLLFSLSKVIKPSTCLDKHSRYEILKLLQSSVSCGRLLSITTILAVLLEKISALFNDKEDFLSLLNRRQDQQLLPLRSRKRSPTCLGKAASRIKLSPIKSSSASLQLYLAATLRKPLTNLSLINPLTATWLVMCSVCNTTTS